MMHRSNHETKMDTANEPDMIHRILAFEEPIVPSSGFLASVMELVEDEARMPASIPFPWKRFVPGILLAAGVFGWAGYEFIGLGIASLRSLTFAPLHLPSSAVQPLEQAGWVVLALAVSLLSWKLSRRLTG
jgi:hypothetical protein